MRTLIYLRWPVVVALLISIFFFYLPVSAQESDIRVDTNASTTIDSQTKVDAGNALNARAGDPIDSDGDGYGDAYIEIPPRDIDKPFLSPNEEDNIPSIREGGRTIEARNIPETQQQQDNGSDVSTAKGTKGTIRWSVEEGKAKVVSGGGGSGKATFKSKLREAGLSEEAATEFLAKLDRLKIDVVLDDEINEVDGSTSQWSLHNISISANDLRDWTDTDRKSHQALKQTLNEAGPEYASLLLVEHMLEDDRIESITSNNTSLNMLYRAKIKLFGLIPLEDTVVATLQLPGVDDVVWNMSVAVDWPWYTRFLSTKESADTIDKTVLSVAKKAKFKGGKALAETVK